MVIDYTITLGHIISLLVISGGLFAAWYSLKSKTDRAFDKATEVQRKIDELEDKVGAVEKRMLSEFVSINQLHHLENRIIGQLNSFEQKIDGLMKLFIEKK